MNFIPLVIIFESSGKLSIYIIDCRLIKLLPVHPQEQEHEPLSSPFKAGHECTGLSHGIKYIWYDNNFNLF